MENVVVILVFLILGLIIGITVGIKFNSQVTQLRIEHEALKKNLKELGVLKEEQEPEEK